MKTHCFIFITFSVLLLNCSNNKKTFAKENIETIVKSAAPYALSASVSNFSNVITINVEDSTGFPNWELEKIRTTYLILELGKEPNILNSDTLILNYHFRTTDYNKKRVIPRALLTQMINEYPEGSLKRNYIKYITLNYSSRIALFYNNLLKNLNSNYTLYNYKHDFLNLSNEYILNCESETAISAKLRLKAFVFFYNQPGEQSIQAPIAKEILEMCGGKQDLSWDDIFIFK